MNKPLSPRQREVLDLLGQGLCNKQIEQQLHIAHGTLTSHLTEIYARMGVHTRLEAVVAVSVRERPTVSPSYGLRCRRSVVVYLKG